MGDYIIDSDATDPKPRGGANQEQTVGVDFTKSVTVEGYTGVTEREGSITKSITVEGDTGTRDRDDSVTESVTVSRGKRIEGDETTPEKRRQRH